MKKKYILFDLDGTLTDPALGITNSIMYALDKMNVPCPKREDLYVFIGPPLHASFMDFFHFDSMQADQAMAYYREYFKTKGLLENSLYPHTEKLLKQLKEEGYLLALATSKPLPFAKKIMEHFHLARYMDVICGSDPKKRSESKADVIKDVLTFFNNPQPELCLMIGDRKFDAIGASTFNIDCLGVTYGYGSLEELQNSHCIAIVNDEMEILNYLKKAS